MRFSSDRDPTLTFRAVRVSGPGRLHAGAGSICHDPELHKRQQHSVKFGDDERARDAGKSGTWGIFIDARVTPAKESGTNSQRWEGQTPPNRTVITTAAQFIGLRMSLKPIDLYALARDDHPECPVIHPAKMARSIV